MAEMWDYWLYSMNAPFGRTHVTRGWNRDLVLYDHTFSNLSGMERECARTMRSSSKVSNSTFQPLVGFQDPPRIGVVPVIKICNHIEILVTLDELQQMHRRYPRGTPMETPGTDWATSAVIVPAAHLCLVHKN